MGIWLIVQSIEASSDEINWEGAKNTVLYYC